MFVALVGAASDGHDYLRAAVDAGASALVVNEDQSGRARELGVPVIAVEETRRELGAFASFFFGRPSDEMSVVGITGTNGKTTVTYLIEAVLTAADLRPGILGTVNYRWPGHSEPAANTTPESLVIQRLLARMRDDGVGAVAMEVSSHGLATHRLEGTFFDVGVFTNLSQDHLDFHGSMRDYREAKAALFQRHLVRSASAGKRPVAVLNVDDAEGSRLSTLQLDGVKKVTYSAAGIEADWSCRQWEQSVAGTKMEIATPHGELALDTRLLGEFNVANVLATLAACDAVGVETAVAADSLRDLRGVPGRLQHLGGKDRPDVFVDYAHTPDALRRALQALRPLTARRLVVVFGCGGDRDRDKRRLMGEAARELADFVVLTSDNPRSEPPAAIIDDIRPSMAGAAVDDLTVARGWTDIVDRREAILRAICDASPGDVVLIAGKGHETYQEIEGVRRAFDDVATVEEGLR